MILRVLKIALLLSGVLALPVLVIRAQPYDNSAVRAVLTPPDDCAAPCFIGIRPGETVFSDGMRILQRHDWVDRLGRRRRVRPNTRYTTWLWSGTQPYLDRGISESYLISVGDTITDISIQTSIPLVEIWWLYGQPEWVQQQRAGDGTRYYTFAYPDHNMAAIVRVANCANLSEVLTAPSRLAFTLALNQPVSQPPAGEMSDLPLTFFRNVNPCRYPQRGT
jgi:hypothetical protein